MNEQHPSPEPTGQISPADPADSAAPSSAPDLILHDRRLLCRNLPYPKRIDIAVPANRLYGDCPDEAEILSQEPDGPSVQG